MSGVICATLIDASPLKICGDLRVAVVFCAVDRGERRRRVLMIMSRGACGVGYRKKAPSFDRGIGQGGETVGPAC